MNLQQPSNNKSKANVLNGVDNPSDIKKLSASELQPLADDVREMIIDCVSQSGGHLAASLGAVELTVALLKAFDPPSDKILWDVSHQTYAYKILTGRKERFCTIRQYGGLSGFLKRSESEYDAFGAGHAGTALSAALGMAYARDLKGKKEHIVAVVGDGSAGCGITFEALNNLAAATRRIIVVLNDNEMSIGANVGSVSCHLGSLLANPRYNTYKSSVETIAGKMHLNWLRSSYYRIEAAIKSLFLRSVIFEEFGLRYVGPINGHNIPAMLDALAVAKNSKQPILLHVATQKGKGYSFAEARPDHWHGTGKFDIESGKATENKPGGYSACFGKSLTSIAEQDKKVVAITAAMQDGTGLTSFAMRFPERFFDVGIAEEHGAVFAAGLAAAGLKPVFAVYSTFFQRCIDPLVHDICLQNLPVVFCLDRAGVVGPDGPTHHGMFDLSMVCSIPDLTIMQPGDELELGNMLYTALQMNAPVVIRYPKGGKDVVMPREHRKIDIGKALVVRDSVDGKAEKAVWFWALGDMVEIAQECAALIEQSGISAGIVNARFVRPLDCDLLKQHCGNSDAIVTLENGAALGGFGSLVESEVHAFNSSLPVIRVGWPDRFIEHGKNPNLMRDAGITVESICARVMSALGKSGG